MRQRYISSGGSGGSSSSSSTVASRPASTVLVSSSSSRSSRISSSRSSGGSRRHSSRHNNNNDNGNRSHPNLMKLDSLVLNYDGWEEDFKKCEDAHFDGNDYGFDRLLQTLEKKQLAFDGDRSHPRLVALDAVTLTYPGWEVDYRIAEKSHFDWEEGTDFWDIIRGLTNKQRIYLGDRSHPNLVRLDSYNLSYSGWEVDFRKAEDAHNDGFTWGFERILQKMGKKQQVYDGDRSHPRLVALDALELTYPGWEADIRKAEETHYDWEEGSDFWDMIKGLKNKQSIHVGDRSHPNLVKLDALVLTYPHWEYDFKKAEEAHNDGFDWGFERRYNKLKKKQRVFDGDRSHPQLVELDSLILTYPGWEADKLEAEQTHYDWEEGSDFGDKLKGMRNKQQYFCGNMARGSTTDNVITRRDTTSSAVSSSTQVATERRALAVITPEHARSVDNNNRTKRKNCKLQQKSATTTAITAATAAAAAIGIETTKNLVDLLGQCIICGEEDKSHIFVPCGHLCVCETCAQISITTYGHCPICRGPSTQAIKVFFS